MKIRIKRTYFREDCTIGFLQIFFSGDYQPRMVEEENFPRMKGDVSPFLPFGGGKGWGWRGATLEPHAIPWKDDPFIGQKAGVHVAGKTAIPEGTYQLEIRDSKTYKRRMPFLKNVPEFKNIVLRTGKKASQTRGDILVGDLKTFNLLFSLIEEAIDYGETVWLEVRSPREWKYPIRKDSVST